jgi:hypothetical protein
VSDCPANTGDRYGEDEQSNELLTGAAHHDRVRSE